MLTIREKTNKGIRFDVTIGGVTILDCIRYGKITEKELERRVEEITDPKDIFYLDDSRYEVDRARMYLDRFPELRKECA